MDNKQWMEFCHLMDSTVSMDPFIQSLQDAGVNLSHRNEDGTTMLHYAAECGNMDKLRYLIKKGVAESITNIADEQGLHIAARIGHIEMAQFFINSKLYIDHRNRNNCTPLIIAAESFKKGIVELLMASNANIQFKAPNGKTVLHYACQYGWLDVVQSLVAKECSLNNADNDGNLPLFLAAENYHEHIFEFLIDSGAKVYMCQQNSEKWTALHYACHYGWLNAVKCLVKRKCNINSKSSAGDSPLFLAVNHVHPHVVEYLVQSGAKVQLPGGERCWTLLHHAACEGWPDVVSSVINKCNIHAQGRSFRRTPLHVAVRFACHSAHLAVIERLLKAGANTNVIKNRHGQTAFNECILNHFCLESLPIFIKHGAYFQSGDYDAINNKPEYKAAILTNVQLCTQAVINKFNNLDLPKIYEIPGIAERIPRIGTMKIANHATVAQDIADNINDEIQTKGFCNVMNERPIGLSSWCIRSLLQRYNSMKRNSIKDQASKKIRLK